MSYETYKILHLAGIGLVLLSFGGLAMTTDSRRKLLLMLHGIGLFIVLLGGFGLLARLEIVHFPWPAWVFGKMGIWLLLGGAIALFKRKPEWSSRLLWLVWGVFVAAAMLAVLKPGF